MDHFYELKCPCCGHRFVWYEGTDKNSSGTLLYRRKGFKEELLSTPCPKCSVELAVLTDSHTGIPIQDDSIEVAAHIRGI